MEEEFTVSIWSMVGSIVVGIVEEGRVEMGGWLLFCFLNTQWDHLLDPGGVKQGFAEMKQFLVVVVVVAGSLIHFRFWDFFSVLPG